MSAKDFAGAFESVNAGVNVRPVEEFSGAKVQQ